MSDNLYWGDLHSHCAVSYGYGTIEQAFANARLHLDFATVTGHERAAAPRLRYRHGPRHLA